jgi:hypothetical protein
VLGGLEIKKAAFPKARLIHGVEIIANGRFGIEFDRKRTGEFRHIFSSLRPERLALNQGQHQIPETISVLVVFLHDFRNRLSLRPRRGSRCNTPREHPSPAPESRCQSPREGTPSRIVRSRALRRVVCASGKDLVHVMGRI